MIQETSTMVASLKELKNLMRISPSSPSFRKAIPKTMANTTRPRIFIPCWSVPIGTYSQMRVWVMWCSHMLNMWRQSITNNPQLFPSLFRILNHSTDGIHLSLAAHLLLCDVEGSISAVLLNDLVTGCILKGKWRWHAHTQLGKCFILHCVKLNVKISTHRLEGCGHQIGRKDVSVEGKRRIIKYDSNCVGCVSCDKL